METKIYAGAARIDLGIIDIHLAGSSFKEIGANSKLVPAEQGSRVKGETNLTQLFECVFTALERHCINKSTLFIRRGTTQVTVAFLTNSIQSVSGERLQGKHLRPVCHVHWHLWASWSCRQSYHPL